MELLRIEQSGVSPDGERITLRMTLADSSAVEMGLWSGYADTLSLLLGSLAADARAVRKSGNADQRIDLVAMHSLRQVSLGEVRSDGLPIPVLHLDLVAGMRVSLELRPTDLRPLLEHLDLASRVFERGLPEPPPGRH